MPAPDLLGLLLGDLLDVDAPDRREDHHRLLADPVPHDPGVVLLLDGSLGIDQYPAWHVPAYLQGQDVARVRFGLLGRVGELDPAGLHAPPGEHLGLDDRGPSDPPRDRAGLGGVGREAVVGDGDAGALDDLARLELEEPHAARKPTRSAVGEGSQRLANLEVSWAE